MKPEKKLLIEMGWSELPYWMLVDVIGIIVFFFAIFIVTKPLAFIFFGLWATCSIVFFMTLSFFPYQYPRNTEKDKV